MRIGHSSVTITPEAGYPLGGYLERYMGENKAIGKLNDIFADVFYFDVDDGVLLISLELIGIERWFYEKVKKYANSLGIRNVIIATTHTHSAPETILEFPFFKLFIKGYAEYVRKYLNFLMNRLTIAIEEAVESVKDQEMTLFTGTINDICSCRNDPSKKFNNIFLAIKIGRTVILRYACHPTVLSAKNMLYSGDFFSYTREYIKQQVDNIQSVAIFNGAAGDLSTRFMRRAQTPEEARRIGYKLGEQIVQKLREHGERISNITPINFEVKVRRRTIDLKSLKETLNEKINTAKRMLDSADYGLKRKLQNEIMMEEFILKNIDMYGKALNELPIEITVPISVLMLNSRGLVSFPFELYSDFEAILNEHNLYVLGYANDYLGYAPTRDIYSKMEYEAMASILEIGEPEKMVKEVLRRVKEYL